MMQSCCFWVANMHRCCIGYWNPSVHLMNTHTVYHLRYGIWQCRLTGYKGPTHLWWTPAHYWLSHVTLCCLKDLEPSLPITEGLIRNHNTEGGDVPRIKLTALTFFKAHTGCQLLNLTQIQGSPVMKQGGWGVSQPLAFVNCMSHIILAGTVNWKRSRGFAVLMSFLWTQVIL